MRLEPSQGRTHMFFLKSSMEPQMEEEPIDIDSLTPEQMKEMLKKMMRQQ